MTTKIITHHRHFNLDEIAAIALLDFFHLNGDYEIIRCDREKNTLDAFLKDKNTFVIDTGLEYSPELLNFDHHQKSMNLKWDGGIPYSSCGLIWKWLKDNNKIDLSNNEKLFFESNFIRKVDAQDNGLGLFHDFSFVHLSNRNHSDNNYIDNLFKQNLELVKNYIQFYLDGIKEKNKNIFKNNAKTNVFLDKLVSDVIVRKYAFINDFSITYKDNIIRFDTTDKHGEVLVYQLDFDKYTFDINEQKINVKNSFTNTIWDFLKETNRLNSYMNQETIEILESNVFNKFKNLGTPFPDMQYVSMYEDKDEYKKEALKACSNFFSNTFAFARQELKGNKEIKKMVKKSKEYEGFVLFEQNIKTAPSKILDFDKDAKLLILPRDKKSWKIQNVNRKDNTFFFPKEWRGLSENKLKSVSGISNLSFCHKSGYMCMFNGSKDEVIEFVNNLVKNDLKIKNKNKTNVSIKKKRRTF